MHLQGGVLVLCVWLGTGYACPSDLFSHTSPKGVWSHLLTWWFSRSAVTNCWQSWWCTDYCDRCGSEGHQRCGNYCGWMTARERLYWFIRSPDVHLGNHVCHRCCQLSVTIWSMWCSLLLSPHSFSFRVHDCVFWAWENNRLCISHFYCLCHADLDVDVPNCDWRVCWGTPLKLVGT